MKLYDKYITLCIYKTILWIYDIIMKLCNKYKTLLI